MACTWHYLGLMFLVFNVCKCNSSTIKLLVCIPCSIVVSSICAFSSAENPTKVKQQSKNGGSLYSI